MTTIRRRYGFLGVVSVSAALVLAGCGGDDGGGFASDLPDGGDDAGSAGPGDDGASDSSGGGDGGGGSGGGVVNPQPPGQAAVSVDGQEFVFDLAGGIPCLITDESFSFSFRIGDNEVVLGGGGTFESDQWFGDIHVDSNPPGNEEGITQYVADVIDHGVNAIAIEGVSMSYSGPMEKLPPNDGSNPPAVPVGDGTISVTCG